MPTENLNPQDPPWIGQISTKSNFILIYSFHREDWNVVKGEEDGLLEQSAIADN